MKTLKAQIEAHVKKWVPIVGLQHWDITIKYHTIKDSKNFAAAFTLPQYQELEIDFNLGKIPELSVAGVEKLVLHELCHAPLASLSKHLTGHHSHKMISYLDEQATSTFANALWRATGRKLGHV